MRQLHNTYHLVAGSFHMNSTRKNEVSSKNELHQMISLRTQLQCTIEHQDCVTKEDLDAQGSSREEIWDIYVNAPCLTIVCRQASGGIVRKCTFVRPEADETGWNQHVRCESKESIFSSLAAEMGSEITPLNDSEQQQCMNKNIQRHFVRPLTPGQGSKDRVQPHSYRRKD